MFRNSTRVLTLAVALCAVMGTAACKTTGEIWRYEAAERLSAPANLTKRQVLTDPYAITVYERIGKKGNAATIYFEGDGSRMNTTGPSASDSKTVTTNDYHEDERTASMPIDSKGGTGTTTTSSSGGPSALLDKNPTPVYPLGLHLAAHDLADNVIFVARPCQYSGMTADRPGTLCKDDVWSDGRYSIETLNAMNEALDKLQKRYSLTGFNLVGVDGGAAVAVLLAAKRKDVLTLRTVGGILDTDAQNANHKGAPFTGSLNPKDFAKDIANIPQHHFLGEWDKDVTPDIYQNFRNAMGPSACLRYSLVAEVNHTEGWANRWPSLLEQPLDCAVTGQ